MNAIVRNIPNTVTCMNLIAGCLAIACTFADGNPVGSLTGLQCAYICVAIAAVADFCDGLAARLLHAYSNLGKELDSLCDMVSFGVAPAAMVYRTMQSDPTMSSWGWVALSIAVCGALRLARFNVDDRQTTTFIGLPIPANAIFWIGFTSLMTQYPGFTGPFPVIVLVLLESWLMISPLKMFSLKLKHLGWKGNQVRWILIAIAVVSVVSMGVSGLMWLIVAYVLLSRLKIAYSE